MKLLSPLVVLLDPDCRSRSTRCHVQDKLIGRIIVITFPVHTLPLVRNEQPTLFLAIMFAASRFWQTSKHTTIKQLLDNKISQAAITGNCHIVTIQAIIILVFWQEPRDRSVWIKSGLAIRMAYQAGLHKVQGVSTSALDEAGIRRLRVSRARLVRKHPLTISWS